MDDDIVMEDSLSTMRHTLAVDAITLLNPAFDIFDESCPSNISHPCNLQDLCPLKDSDNGSYMRSSLDRANSIRSYHQDLLTYATGSATQVTENVVKPKFPNSNPLLEIRGNNVKYVGKGKHSFDVAVARAHSPFQPKDQVGYFEVKVVSSSDRVTISVGVAQSSSALNKHPGFETSSYGYFGDDGSRVNSGHGYGGYGPRFGVGDVVGCGFYFVKGVIFFTLNGKYLGDAFTAEPDPLFPSVGLHHPSEAVEVNFGDNRFVFDLLRYKQVFKSARFFSSWLS
ncbi:Ran-binding protein 9 [Phlyctochytrium planicorne]|nr:Ran-binding protein 9 [Phlyctochytrium planicorne]